LFLDVYPPMVSRPPVIFGRAARLAATNKSLA
jgi:hypothetical protein